MKAFIDKRRVVPATLLAVLFCTYLVLNILTPVLVDDCSYGATARTLHDIFARQYHDYFSWSGRVVAHSVAQCFAGIVGKGVFDVVNSLMMCLLAMLLSSFCANHRDAVLPLATAVVWFLLPDNYITQFLICGSINYVWAAVMVLVFLHLLCSARAMSAWRVIVGCLFALLCGSWSEMFAVCILPAMAIVILVRKEWRTMSINQWLMLLAYLVGACFVIFAPGNFVRSGDISSSFGTSTVNLFVNVVRSPLPWMWLATTLLSLSSGAKFWRDNLFPLLATFFSLLFCMFSGAAWPRTHFPAYIFSAIMLLGAFSKLTFRKGLVELLTVGVLGAVGVDCYFQSRNIEHTRQMADLIVSQTAAGHDVFFFDQKPSRKSIGSNAFSSSPTNWRNQSFAKYYGTCPFAVHPLAIADVDGAGTCSEYRVVEMEDDVCGLRLVFSDDTLYRLPSKLARILDAFGTHLHQRRYLSRNSPPPIVRHLLKPEVGLYRILMLPSDNGNFSECGEIAVDGHRFIYYPLSVETMGNYNVERIEPIKRRL